MESDTQTVEGGILKRIYASGMGEAFTPSDFLDLGTRQAVDVSLHRMVNRKMIRRLARGIYDYPREHPELGTLSPDIEKVAQALAGKDRIRMQPAGAYATNLLGLSEQVPAKVVFLTDGPSRTVKIGAARNPVAPHDAAQYGSRRAIERAPDASVSTLGKEHITQERMEHLKRTLPAKERQQLLKDLRLAPAWMHPLFQELAGE